MKKNLPFLFIISIFLIPKTQAQSASDYQSVKSGDWASVATWQTYNGTAWVAATTAPSNASGTITIITADSIAVTDTVFADQVVLQAGAKLNVLSRFVLMNGDGTDLLANGNIAIQLGGRIDDDTLTGGSTVDYKAAELYTASGLSPLTTFDGATTQTIDGPGYFGNITLNNPNNLIITGSEGFRGVNFINGRIIVAGNFLLGQYSSGFTGQGPTRFIDGNMVCIMFDNSNITFDLPIGKNGHYSPMVLKAQQDVSAETEILVAIKDSAAPAHTLPVTLDKVSAVRYVTLSRNESAGTITSASLQLSYDSTDGVTDPANLRIAKSDTAGGVNNWVNIGGIGSAVKNGTITSTVNFITWGDFALANATGGSNTLPLHFVDFTATPNKQTVALNWQTADEVNTSYFNVERSVSANNWVIVGTVNANKNATANNYSFTDASTQNTGSYIYRIKEVDKDGSAYFSNDVLVRLQDGSGKMSVSVLYPNPATDVLNYYVSSAANDAVTVVITGLSGKVFAVQHSAANQSMQVGVKNLASGPYIITFTNTVTGEKVVKKLVKM